MGKGVKIEKRLNKQCCRLSSQYVKDSFFVSRIFNTILLYTF